MRGDRLGLTTMSHYSNNAIDNGGGPTGLTTSDRCHLLADAHRRAAMEVLTDESLPVDLRALASAIADRNEIDRSAKQVATTLHHVHLPKLSDFGVIDYDSEANRVDSVLVRLEPLDA